MNTGMMNTILRAVAQGDARGGPWTVAGIAARADVSESTVRRYLTPMAEQGLVRPAQTNHNATAYYVTDAGRATLPDWALA